MFSGKKGDCKKKTSIVRDEIQRNGPWGRISDSGVRGQKCLQWSQEGQSLGWSFENQEWKLYGTEAEDGWRATVLPYAMGKTPPDMVDSRRDCMCFERKYDPGRVLVKPREAL